MTLVAALPVSDRGFGPFLDELYAAALEPNRFSQALATFAEVLNADQARILVCDRYAPAGGRVQAVEFGEAIDGADPKQLNDLVLQVASRDSNAVQAVHCGSLSGAGWPNEKWAIGGVQYLALTVAVDERWAVALVALRRHAPFGEHDQIAARRLADDVRRALSFHFKAARIKGFTLGDRLFEARSIALIVTRQRIVEHTNEAAVQLLEQQGLVRLAGRALRFEDTRIAAAFDELSKQTGRRAAKSMAFVVSEGHSGTWLVQLSQHQTAAASPLIAEAANGTLVVVALTSLNAASISRGALIDGFVDLTVTERSVLAAFVDGKDIASIAGEMQRSVETVRWHVRNLFAKLGVNSQAELTRLGSLLLPI